MSEGSQLAADVNEAIKANNASLLTAINSLVNEKIGSLKRSLDDSAEKHADQQMGEIKKLKYGETYAFKRKANEDQFNHNKRALETFSEAQEALQAAKYSKVSETLESCIDLVSKRQKLILIADKSEFGWKTAQEYVRDELLDDSDDEKRYWKAEFRAGKKCKDAAKKKPKRPDFRPVANSNAAGSSMQAPLVRKRGPCFACGGDHWRAECPRRQAGSSSMVAMDSATMSKISPDLFNINNYYEPTGFEPAIAPRLDYLSSNDTSEAERGRIADDGQSVSGNEHDIIFKGRLAKHISFWNSFTDSAVVLNIVAHGYRLPFISVPESKFMKNNKSAFSHNDFVELSILELLKIGSITECAHPPFIVNPLTVSVKSEGKKRLILDLRYVNLFVFKQKFKCEDLSTVVDILKPNDFMFKFDLKSGYHHVEIHDDYHKFLGFSWKFDSGVTRYFMFNVLPFGLSSAPYIFTKILKPLVSKWRSEGKRVVLFIDDGLCLSDSFNLALQSSVAVKSDLVKAGFVPNEEKSEWVPVQNIVWLGIIIDTILSKLFVTAKRLSKAKPSITHLFQNDTCVKVKVLACLAGQIISMSLAVGQVCRLMTRAMYKCIESRKTWWSFVFLNENVRRELMFWLTNIDRLNGKSFITNQQFREIVYSDASDTGFGGFVVSNPSTFSRANWNEAEKTKSSTWRELKAVSMVLLSFLPNLHKVCLKWFSDNQNVVKIIEAGSSKPDLQELSLEIFDICRSREITICMEWVPREGNEQADIQSRVLDLDDWELNYDSFKYLDYLWGPHTVDRFATWYNSKLPRFNSPCIVPGSEAVDAFTQSWVGENNYLLPPPNLIAKCISKIIMDGCHATIVIPLWVSAAFWPLLCSDGVHFNHYVVDWREINPSKHVFLKGRTNNTLFGGKDLPFRMVALRCFEIINPRVGIWADVAAVAEPELLALSSNLVDVVIRSKAPNTVALYHSGFKKWTSFAVRHGLVKLPASESLYATELINARVSVSVFNNSVYSIKWGHDMAGLSSPLDHPFVKTVLDAGRRSLSKRRNPKEPVRPSHIVDICTMFKSSDCLSIVRDVTLCVLAFSGFLRYDELVHIKAIHVKVHSLHLEIFIAKSKTDQLRQGHSVYISKTGLVSCPLSWVNKYILLANIKLDENVYFFKQIQCFKGGKRLVCKDKPLSYTRTREIVLNKIKLVETNFKRFGIHSLRSGGASAASNAGISHQAIKTHGRWKSDSAKDLYIKDSLENRLFITQNLGI